MAIAGRHLGTIWASVALDVAPLGAGAARARRLLYATDASLTKWAAGVSGKTAAGAAKAGQAILGIGRAATMAATVVGAASVKMASDFDAAVRRAGSVAMASEAQMKEWGSAILKLSQRYPDSAADIADALYWIKSDMPDATDTEQWETLEIAMRGATGGVAELEDATEALIVVQNAYADQDPAKYMDLMNWAVTRGSITLQDFVNNMGKATGTAAMTGVKFEELSAAVATLTRKGIPADTAFMALNQTMMKYLKPSAQAVEEAKKYGIELTANTLKTKGLAGAMMELVQKIPEEEQAEAFADMFENVRALKAVFPLAGTAADEFAKDLALAGEAANISDKMFEVNAASMENQFKILVNNIRKPLIELGTKIFPIVIGGLEALVGIIKGAIPVVVGFATAFLAWKTISFIGNSLQSVGLSLMNFTGRTAEAGLQMGMMGVGLTRLAGPIGIAAGAIAGIGLGIYAWVRHLGALEREMDSAAESVSPYVNKILEIQNAMSGVSDETAEWKRLNDELETNMKKVADIMPIFIEKIDEQGKVIEINIERYQEWLEITGRGSKAAQKFATATPTDKVLSLNQAMAEQYTVMKDNEKALDTLDFQYRGHMITQAQYRGETDKIIKKNQEAEKQIGLLANEIGSAMPIALEAFGEAGRYAGEAGESITRAFSTTGMQEAIKQMNYLTPAIRRTATQAVLAYTAEWMRGKQIAEPVIQSFINGITPILEMPGIRKIGAGVVFDWAVGLMENQNLPPDRINEILNNINSIITDKDFKSMGEQKAREWLTSMLTTMGLAPQEIGSIVDAIIEKTKKPIKVSDAGSARATVKSLTQVEQKAKEVGKQKPNVKVRGDTAQPNAALSRLLNRLKSIDGTTQATFYVQALIRGSGPFTVDEYVRYLQERISSANPLLMISGTSAIDALSGAFAGLTSTGLFAWQRDFEMINKEGGVAKTTFEAMEIAIASLAKESAGPAIDAWRAMRNQIEAANVALKASENEIKTVQEYIKKLQAEQVRLNKSVQEWQDRLTYLSGLKISGETAAGEELYSLGVESQKLQLAIMQAEDEYNYELAAQLQLQKDALDRRREELELQKQITFEPLHHQLENMMDTMYGQEDTFEAISRAVIIAKESLATEKASLDAVNAEMDRQNLILTGLQDSYNNAQEATQEFSSEIDKLAQSLLEHYRNMVAQEEAAKAGYSAGGPGPVTRSGWDFVPAGSFVLTPRMMKMGYPKLNLENTNSTTVHVPVYLDSRKIAHATTRVTGQRANALQRSGGRY